MESRESGTYTSGYSTGQLRPGAGIQLKPDHPKNKENDQFFIRFHVESNCVTRPKNTGSHSRSGVGATRGADR